MCMDFEAGLVHNWKCRDGICLPAKHTGRQAASGGLTCKRDITLFFISLWTGATKMKKKTEKIQNQEAVSAAGSLAAWSSAPVASSKSEDKHLPKLILLGAN